MARWPLRSTKAWTESRSKSKPRAQILTNRNFGKHVFEVPVPAISLLGREDQEVIHLVALHKIALTHQSVSRLSSLSDHHLGRNAVVFSIAVAIDDPHLGARLE